MNWAQRRAYVIARKTQNFIDLSTERANSARSEKKISSLHDSYITETMSNSVLFFTASKIDHNSEFFNHFKIQIETTHFPEGTFFKHHSIFSFRMQMRFSSHAKVCSCTYSGSGNWGDTWSGWDEHFDFLLFFIVAWCSKETAIEEKTN